MIKYYLRIDEMGAGGSSSMRFTGENESAFEVGRYLALDLVKLLRNSVPWPIKVLADAINEFDECEGRGVATEEEIALFDAALKLLEAAENRRKELNQR